MDETRRRQLALVAYRRRMTETGRGESWARSAAGLERQLGAEGTDPRRPSYGTEGS